jgi:hypothetical protein
MTPRLYGALRSPRYYVRCEQPGALAIKTDCLTLREAIVMARGVRRSPPPPWTGAWVRMSLCRESGRILRAWEYLHPDGWKRTDMLWGGP